MRTNFSNLHTGHINFGPYLIAQHARSTGDSARAAAAMRQAHANDPGNVDLLYDTYIALALNDDFALAAQYAKKLPQVAEGQSLVGAIIIAADYIKNDNFEAAFKALSQNNLNNSGGLVIMPILRAWTMTGTGKHTVAQAIRQLDSLKADKNHRPLYDLNVQQIRAKESPVDGIANSLYIFAISNYKLGNIDTTELFARMVLFLRPDSPDAIAVLGSVLEARGFYTQADAVYDRIDPKSPAYPIIARKKAMNKLVNRHFDTALMLFERLAKAHPDNPMFQLDIGDTLRAQRKFDQAVRHYTNAINLFGDDKDVWTAHFGRAIAYEQNNQWKLAEADLLRALEIVPDNFEIMNYLAYVWTDRNENLDKAQEMLERAARMAPRNPEIIDSLGWVYFKQGKLDKAIKYLEQAAAMLPAHPVVNYHLGEAYYQAGRKLEAAFQFNRALNAKDAKDELKPAEIQRMRNFLDSR